MVDWKKYGELFSEEFTEKIQAEWKERGFNKDQCKEWLKVGLQSNDADYAKWLRDIEQDTPEDFQKYGDDKSLREKHQKHQGENEVIQNIPLERLYIIRRDISEFIEKWGREESYYSNYHWYNKLWTKKYEDRLGKIDKLQSPEELWKYRLYMYGARFVSHAATVAGTALTLQEGGIATGIGILAITPFSELVSWKIEEKLEIRRERWREFLDDAKVFLSNYHELLSILAPIDVKNLREGRINNAIKNLNDIVERFLRVYDEDGNRTVEFSELIKRRHELAKDLSMKDSKTRGVRGIINFIIDLENKVIKHHQGFNYEDETEEKISVHEEINDLDNYFEKERELVNNSNNDIQLLTNPEDKNTTDLRKRISHVRNDSNSDLVDAQGQEEKQVEPATGLTENNSKELQTNIEVLPK